MGLARLAKGVFGRKLMAVGALVAMVFSCSSPPIKTVPGAVRSVSNRDDVSTSEEQLVGQVVTGLPADSDLWDVAVPDSGTFVAVGTVPTKDDSVPLLVWRSEDGRSWRQVLRSRDLGYDSSYVPEGRGAVVAHRDGFAIVGSYCTDVCTPFALHSADGTDWREVEMPVRPPSGAAGIVRPASGIRPAGLGAKRLVLATPDFTLRGPEMFDVVAAEGRLVAVGWSEVGTHMTGKAVWLSDDGGRTWRQVSEGAIPQPGASRDQLDEVVVAGDRLVARGGNRCCYDQSVGEVWISEDGGETWRPVGFPEKPVNISGFAAVGGAVHVVGSIDWESDRQAVHWRLSPDDAWDRLPAVRDDLLARPRGLLAVTSETTVVSQQRRLVVLESADGTKFRMAGASAPREELDLDATLVVGDGLVAHVKTGAREDRRRFVFELAGGAAQARNGSDVWAARVRPSPVLYGEGVRVPDEDGGFVDVTPAQKTSSDLVADAFFLDRDHGWALLADSETQLRRLVLTTDGGRHWAPGGFGPSTDTPRWLFFVDPRNGWIVAYSDSGIYPKPSSLYRTSDGGATWRGPSPLPACGPVHFDTPGHGWLADPGYSPASCGSDLLHETTDGGETWTTRSDVPPPGVSGRRISGYGPPRFGVLPAWLSGNRVAFLVSEDNGRNWELAADVEFPAPEPAAIAYPEASIAGKTLWWATDGNGTRVSVTTDGGKQWRHRRPTGVRGRLVGPEAIDGRRAWAVESNSAGVRLVTTRDGGATWRPLVK